MPWEEREGTNIAKLLGAMRGSRQTSPIWTQDQAATAMSVKRALVPNYIAAACNAGVLHRRTVHGGLELSLDPFPASTPSGDLRIPTFGKAAATAAADTVTGYVPPRMMAPRPGSEHPRVLTSTPRPAPLGAPPAPAPAAVGPEAAAADALVVAESSAPALRPGDGTAEVTNPPVAPPNSSQTVLAPSAAQGAESGESTEETGEEEEVEFDYCTWRNGNVQIWGAQVAEDGSVVLTQEQLEEIARGGPAP